MSRLRHISSEVYEERLGISIMSPVETTLGLSWRIELASIIDALVAVCHGGGAWLREATSRLLVDHSVTIRLNSQSSFSMRLQDRPATPTGEKHTSLKKKKEEEKKEMLLLISGGSLNKKKEKKTGPSSCGCMFFLVSCCQDNECVGYFCCACPSPNTRVAIIVTPQRGK